MPPRTRSRCGRTRTCTSCTTGSRATRPRRAAEHFTQAIYVRTGALALAQRDLDAVTQATDPAFAGTQAIARQLLGQIWSTQHPARHDDKCIDRYGCAVDAPTAR